MDTNNEVINWLVKADKLVFAKDQVNLRILEVTLDAKEKAEKTERAPLNLSLVIDHSGSMQGDKLTYVKKAAQHVIDLLSEKDSVAVVEYDDTINLLLPSTLMTKENQATTKQIIASIRSGGSTNLGGGWLKGCEEVAHVSNERTFNRTLLLTDGLANVGMTSLEELAGHAIQLFRRGVSTSTFGVGNGYDEHLLEAMSNGGGGNFHFLETLNAIPLVFEREFLELISVSLKGAELTIELPDGINAEVAAGYQMEREDHYIKIFLGSLYSGRKLATYLRLTFEKNVTKQKLTLPLTLTAKLEDGSSFELKSSLTFDLVCQEEEKATEEDKALMARYAEVDMADKANEALKHERRGDRAGASRIMMDSINYNRPYLSKKSETRYQTMHSQMETGLSEMKRKDFHRQSYESKRMRQMIRDYAAGLVGGCLFTEIEGEKVLIDTGSPISIGNRKGWLFFDDVFQLSQSALGISMNYLGNELGTNVDVLMGTDIIKNYIVTIDLSHNQVHFSDTLLVRSGKTIPFKVLMGTPIIHAKIDGKAMDLFFDTGAKLTYVEKQLVQNLVPISEEKDFYPTLGRFVTPVYELPLEIVDETVIVKCGILPEMLEQAIRMTGAKAILGTEILKTYTTSLDFQNQVITLVR